MDPSQLTLRRLSSEDEQAFFEGLKDWEGEDLDWYTFVWRPGMSFSTMLEILEKEDLGVELPPNRVPATMLYAFVNHKIVGRVSVRHRLNESLKRRGGHLGYAVSPLYRRFGLGTEMLRQALIFCRERQINPVMITCADTNVASWKMIEKVGGTLEDKTWDDIDEEWIRRYWVP